MAREHIHDHRRVVDRPRIRREWPAVSRTIIHDDGTEPTIVSAMLGVNTPPMSGDHFGDCIASNFQPQPAEPCTEIGAELTQLSRLSAHQAERAARVDARGKAVFITTLCVIAACGAAWLISTLTT